MATNLSKQVVLVATFVSAGVAKGAAGFMIVGGKIVKIGPRGPAFAKLAAAVKELGAGKKAGTKSAKRSAKK